MPWLQSQVVVSRIFCASVPASTCPKLKHSGESRPSNHPMTESPYMTRREAANFWRKSMDTIDRWTIKFKWRRVFDPAGGILLLKEDVTKPNTKTRKAIA
jgi:hypothetical protein